MKMFKGLKKLLGGKVKNVFLIGDAPEGTPVHIMSTNLGQNSCMWVHQWSKITKKKGPLRFPKDGTFELQIIDKLREVLCEIKTPSRAAQFEALSMWEKAARDKASEDKKVKHQIQEKEIKDNKTLQINNDSGDEIMDALLTECPPLYVVPIKNTENSVPASTTVATASVEQREIQTERNVQIFQIGLLPVDSALTVIFPGVTASNVTDSVQILQTVDAQVVPRKIVTVPINMVPTKKVQRAAEGVIMSGFISETRNSQIIEQKLPQTVQALKGGGKMVFTTSAAQDKMTIFEDGIFQTCSEEATLIKKIESMGKQISPDPEIERQLNVLNATFEHEEINSPCCLNHENVNQCQEKELFSLSKEIATCAVTTHDRLTDLAQKYEIDALESFPFQKSFRVHMNDEANEKMCSSGMQLHIAEIIKYFFKCNEFEKLGDKWARKHEKKKKPPDLARKLDKKKKPPDLVEENNKQDEGEAFADSLREKVGEVHVHVPRNKCELAAFLNTFPKLRDKLMLWYPQIDGFVEILNELNINLEMLFDIAMQAELWFEYKVAVQRPGEETMKRVCMNASSFSVVMEENEAVITFLKGRVSAKVVNWVIQHCGKEWPNASSLRFFVTQLVVGIMFSDQISVHVQQKLVCLQRKLIDGLLKDEGYYSAGPGMKQKGFEEQPMMLQRRFAQEDFQNQLFAEKDNEFRGVVSQAEEGAQGRFGVSQDGSRGVSFCHLYNRLEHWKKKYKLKSDAANGNAQTQREMQVQINMPVMQMKKSVQEQVPMAGVFQAQMLPQNMANAQINLNQLSRADVNTLHFKMAQQETAVELFSEKVVEKLLSDLKEILNAEIREFTEKDVRLIKCVEHVLFELEPDDMYSKTPSVAEILSIIGDELSSGFLMELIGRLCNFLITGSQKPNKKNRLVQEVNSITFLCCPVVPNLANIFFHIPCAEEWLTVIDFCQVHVTEPLHEDSQECCPKENECLGHIIEKGVRKVSPERVEIIHQMNPPQIQKEVRISLGMACCCSEWLPNLSLVAKPLLRLTQKDVSDPLPLDNNCTKAFLELKEKKCCAPALGMQVYLKENTPICSEREGCALSVPVQKHECAQRSVTYFPVTLDPNVTEMPSCLNLVAVVNVSHKKSENIRMECPIAKMVPSFLELFCENAVSKKFLNSNVFSIEPAIEIGCDETECLNIMKTCIKPRLDFNDERLIEPNNVHFVDGPCLKSNNDTLGVAHAVFSIHYVINASWFSVVISAQISKLFALTIICSITVQMGVTIIMGERNLTSVVQCCVLLAYTFIQGCIRTDFEKNDNCIVANVILQELMRRYKLPVSLKSDHNEVSKMMCAEPQIGQRLDYSYLPEVSRTIKRNKDSTELHFAKDCVSASLKWLEYANALVKNSDEKTNHCREGLADVERVVSHQIPAVTQDRHNEWSQDFDLRDAVKWKGLFQRILAKTVVKGGGLPNWVYASYTRMVLCPPDKTAPLQEKMPAVVKSPQRRVSQAVKEHTEREAALEKTEVALEKVETDSDESCVRRVNESDAASEEEISAVGLRVEVGKSWMKGYPKCLQWSLEKSFAPIAEASESDQSENKRERLGLKKCKEVMMLCQSLPAPELSNCMEKELNATLKELYEPP